MFDFRSLDSSEVATVKKCQQRHAMGTPDSWLKDLQVAYHYYGNFITAVLVDRAGNVQVGTAKRSPRDRENYLTGQTIALSRAAISEGAKIKEGAK